MKRIAVQRPLDPKTMAVEPGPVKVEPLNTLKVVQSLIEPLTGKRIFLLENGQVVYANGLPVVPAEFHVSVNILHLGDELAATEQRRRIQEPKERALKDMQGQANRGRQRAQDQAAKKNPVAPLPPPAKVNRKIDWKE